MASGYPGQRTALVVTVRDEAGTVGALLASIAAQTRPPDEMVFVDGGSQDDTLAVLRAWASRLPLRLIEAPGANISRGRNLGIEAATADVIAVTDAGVRLEPDWLEQLLARLNDETAVVGGFFRPDPTTAFERVMGATVLPDLEDINPDRFLPSSRSVLFRRAAWAAVGGYPEWLDYCEDLVFDRALRRAGYAFAFAPHAIAWFRPRGSLGVFFWQYYRYARGDGKADLWLQRHIVRYVTYALAALALWRRGRWVWLLILGGLAYTRRPYQRLALGLATLPLVERVLLVAHVPIIRLVGDVAKMLGYPVGTWWRLRRRWTCLSSS